MHIEKDRTTMPPLAVCSIQAKGKQFHRPFSNRDRKSTRLNSSHGYISYAVFCLKKKKEERDTREARRRLEALDESRGAADAALVSAGRDGGVQCVADLEAVDWRRLFGGHLGVRH